MIETWEHVRIGHTYDQVQPSALRFIRYPDVRYELEYRLGAQEGEVEIFVDYYFKIIQAHLHFIPA